ncbi:hypothetical protein ACE38W_14470 [Chitinophaga sp. Hz27]|uniref:hypothetical protein n=1 Tax=Chitinophaga sp. Hz27 TaxID=3347169 RepID=UPI0035DD4830
MNWTKVSFTGNEVAKICVQIILGTVFIVMMKTDIRAIADGLSEMKQESKEDRERQRTWQAKVETEYGEIKVRLAILEQRVNNLEISKDANR